MATVKAAMAARVEEAVAETEAKAAGLREAREKNVHFSARVVRTVSLSCGSLVASIAQTSVDYPACIACSVRPRCEGSPCMAWQGQ